MFFILSKVLLFLLNPVTWLLTGLAWWLLAKKPHVRKRLGWAMIIFLLLFSNRAIFSKIAYQWQAPLVWPTVNDTLQAGILLTGMTFTDQLKRSYFGANADRFIQTAKLYKSGVVRKIIITGGSASLNHERPTEAFFLQQEMLALGVPAQDILTETNSRNTYESAVQSRMLLDSLQMRGPFLLVTSAMHLRRAEACFKRQGISVVPWPANITIADGRLNWKMVIIPDLSTLLGWPELLKEMVGYLSYKATGKL